MRGAASIAVNRPTIIILVGVIMLALLPWTAIIATIAIVAITVIEEDILPLVVPPFVAIACIAAITTTES